MTKPDLTIVDISPSALPARTLAGVVWSPVYRASGYTSCEACVLFEPCTDAVDAGNFAGCEGVLQSESWHVPEEVAT